MYIKRKIQEINNARNSQWNAYQYGDVVFFDLVPEQLDFEEHAGAERVVGV